MNLWAIDIAHFFAGTNIADPAIDCNCVNGASMNKKYLTVTAAALLAGPLLLSLSQRAQATINNISGNFTVTISNLNGDGDTLSKENTGSGKSNFTEILKWEPNNTNRITR